MDVQSRKTIKRPKRRGKTEKVGCSEQKKPLNVQPAGEEQRKLDVQSRKNQKMSNRQEKDRKNWMFRAEKPSNVQCMTILYEIICL